MTKVSFQLFIILCFWRDWGSIFSFHVTGRADQLSYQHVFLISFNSSWLNIISRFGKLVTRGATSRLTDPNNSFPVKTFKIIWVGGCLRRMLLFWKAERLRLWCVRAWLHTSCREGSVWPTWVSTSMQRCCRRGNDVNTSNKPKSPPRHAFYLMTGLLD